MFKTFVKSLREWNETYTERAKLQHSYIGLTVVTIIAAGLVGLIDYPLGQRLTGFAMIFLAVFFVNLLVWTLLSGLFLSYLQDQPPTPRKTPPRSKKQ